MRLLDYYDNFDLKHKNIYFKYKFDWINKIILKHILYISLEIISSESTIYFITIIFINNKFGYG